MSFYRPYICRNNPATASWFITRETPYGRGREWWNKKRGAWLDGGENGIRGRRSLFRSYEAAERELKAIKELYGMIDPL